ncbi:sigma-54-dependent Fis family transcriptional regulator [Parasphingorhabdus pacifica]
MEEHTNPSRASHRMTTTTGESETVVQARERFLDCRHVESDAVRGPILASWQRCAEAEVTVDRLDAPFHEDLDTQGRLAHHATLVLDRVRDQLADQPVSVVLTDARGCVLARRTGTHGLRDHLDQVLLAPGFSYAEHFVGTNGIGTALEGRRATYVYQREHYTDQLGELACAGVPVHDPLSGQVAGVLDLTCWAEDANPLLMAMARSAAHDIESIMLGQARGRELALLHEYRQASARCVEPVLAFSSDILMMNDKARNLLSTGDQTALTEHFHTVTGGTRNPPAEIELPSGMRCRVHVNQVRYEAAVAGSVVRVELREAPRVTRPAPRTQPALPGIIGTGPMWDKCCRQLNHHFDDHTPVVLEGERGTGKLALLRAMQQHHKPTGRLRVFDLAEASATHEWIDEFASELVSDDTTVVLRHLDKLPAHGCTRVDQVLRQHRGGGALVTATLSARENHSKLTSVLQHLAHTVEVPPLRHHIEDVEGLVDLFVRQATKGTGPTFAPEAMRALLRGNWPGNIAQLHRVVLHSLKRTRAGVIALEDLPPECRSQNRRVLTPIESMERDAIVRSLAENGGNRARAARTLGISRATIYRRINEYGIDLTEM